MDELTLDIDVQNWAEDSEIGAQAVKFLAPLIQQARSDRATMQDEWVELYNIWDVRRQVSYYNGRANLYLPAGHRTIEKSLAKVMQRLFPSGDDFFDVKSVPPGEGAQDEIASELDAAKAMLWYDLHECIRFRRKMPIWLRQFLILGTSPWATDYITADDLQQGSRVRGRLTKGNDGALSVRAKPRSRIGPTGRPVDLFTWYAWPPTIDDLTDAVVVFEDQLVTEAFLNEWRALGRYVFTDEDIKPYVGVAPQQSIWQQSDRLQQRGATTESTPTGLYVVTTAYAEWHPKGDTKKPKVACQFALVGDEKCLLARQNPWIDQAAPYDVARMGLYVDEWYGRGLIYPIREMQYWLNDTANLTFDTIQYALMPIAAVDPDAIQDPSLLIHRPGAKWPIPPNAVKWHVIPDTHRIGFDAVRQLFEMIQETSGAATGGQYQPTLGVARGAETATGQQLLVSEGNIDVALLASGIEEDALEPLLHRLDAREQQFLPLHQDRILRALGRKGIPLLKDGMRVRREQMAGTRTYTWTGSHISEERQTTQKYGPNLLTVAAKIKETPEGKIDVLGMFEDLYKSFGFGNAADRIKRRRPGSWITPQDEHIVMKAGHPIEPQPGEPHVEHLAAHDSELPRAQAEGWADRLKTHMILTVLMHREESAMGQGQGAPQGGGNGGPPQAQQLLAAMGQGGGR